MPPTGCGGCNVGGRLELAFLLQTTAWLLVAVGAIPPSVLAVLRYAATTDYLWAIRGPFPFNQLGSSPFWLCAFLTTVATTVTRWGAAILLTIAAHRR